MSCSVKMIRRFLNQKNTNIRLYENITKCYSTTSEDLVVEKLEGKHSGVTVFGMNRPDRKNALGVNLVNRLDVELDKINCDAKARVLVIKSLVNGVFCSGADLKERLKMSTNEISIFLHKLKTVMNKVHHLPIPVIASIDGAAFGGGLELSLACDIRIASSCSKLGLVETKLAIIPGAGGTQRLPRLINPALAKELIFTARIIDGREAKEYGMVNHAVEQNENGDGAYLKSLEICGEMLQNGPVALKMAKVAINRGMEADISTGLAIEGACYAQVIPTRDRIEALEAFQSKRKPFFKGE